METIDYSFRKLPCDIRETKELIKQEHDFLESKVKIIELKRATLMPFTMNLYDYLVQCSDVFTEKWEMELAMKSIKSSVDWGNEEYKKGVEEVEMLTNECKIHEKNILILKGNIAFIKSCENNKNQ